MNELERLIAGSYGSVDNLFAGHHNDMERAAQSLVEANNTGVGFADYLEKHRDYLRRKGCTNAHIEEQIEDVQDISNYFTND